MDETNKPNKIENNANNLYRRVGGLRGMPDYLINEMLTGVRDYLVWMLTLAKFKAQQADEGEIANG